MNRESITALWKLAACIVAAVGLLLLWIFGVDLWYRPVAAITFIIVAAPTVLLVSIDTGKVLRRQQLSRVATIVTRVPQYLLGVLAIFGGGVGLILALLHHSDPQVWGFGLFLFSAMLLSYGIRLVYRPESIDSGKRS